MNIEVQTISVTKDLEEIAPLAQRLVEQAMDEFREDPILPGCGLALLQRALASPTGVIMRAVGPDGNTAGLIVTGPLVDPLVGDETAMILLLWTQDAFRRRGMAKRLVACAQEALTARGLTILAARAGHNDDALISMGERSGFIRAYEVLLREG